jgi:hypothetical protein
VLRVRPDASDLPRVLRWLGTHGDAAQRVAEAGRARACALMHPPHVAGYLGRLLQRYALTLTLTPHPHPHPHPHPNPNPDPNPDPNP